jgi:hypothetical protein
LTLLLIQIVALHGMLNQSIVDEALFMDQGDDGQGTLFLTQARLSETFYAQLKKHPVPLEEAAIRGLSNNSMGLDVYAWLAYRLHSLKGATEVPWRAISSQFGGGYDQLKHFKPRFLANLKLAMAVYPDAKVEVDDTLGLILHPSRPPVARLPGSTGRLIRNA